MLCAHQSPYTGRTHRPYTQTFTPPEKQTPLLGIEPAAPPPSWAPSQDVIPLRQSTNPPPTSGNECNVSYVIIIARAGFTVWETYRRTYIILLLYFVQRHIAPRARLRLVWGSLTLAQLTANWVTYSSNWNQQEGCAY